MPRLLQWLRSLPPVRATEEVARELWHEWHADRVNGLAAEVAFFAILSIFPALLAVAAALGSLETFAGAQAAEDARREVLDAMQRVLDTDEAEPLFDAVRELFAQSSTGLLTFAMAGALFAMSRGFSGVIRALNIAYDHEESRPWWRTRLLALSMSLGSVVVMAVVLTMVVVGPLFGAGRDIADDIGLGSVFAFAWDWLRAPFAFLVLVLWAAGVYHVAPSHRSPWRWDLPGALAATVLWLAVSVGFRIYLDVAGGANQVFGVLGGGLIMLVWLYLMSLVLLIGGELNAVLARRAGVLPEPPPHAPAPAGRIRRRREDVSGDEQS